MLNNWNTPVRGPTPGPTPFYGTAAHDVSTIVIMHPQQTDLVELRSQLAVFPGFRRIIFDELGSSRVRLDTHANALTALETINAYMGMRAALAPQDHVQPPPVPNPLASSRMVYLKVPTWVTKLQANKFMCQYAPSGLQRVWYCEPQKRTQAQFSNEEAAARAVKDINSTTTLQAIYIDGLWCTCPACSHEKNGSTEQNLNPQAPEFVPGGSSRLSLSAIGHPDYTDGDFESASVIIPDIEEVKALFEEFIRSKSTVSLNQPPDTNCIHVTNAPTDLTQILFAGLQGFKKISKSSDNVYVQFADPNMTSRALRTLENLLTLGKLGVAGDVVKRAMEGVGMTLKTRRGSEKGSESPSRSRGGTPAVEEKGGKQDKAPAAPISNPVFDASKGPLVDVTEFTKNHEGDETSHLWWSMIDASYHHTLYNMSTEKVRKRSIKQKLRAPKSTRLLMCDSNTQEKKMHDFANHWLLKVKAKDDELRNKSNEITNLKAELQSIKNTGATDKVLKELQIAKEALEAQRKAHATEVQELNLKCKQRQTEKTKLEVSERELKAKIAMSTKEIEGYIAALKEKDEKIAELRDGDRNGAVLALKKELEDVRKEWGQKVEELTKEKNLLVSQRGNTCALYEASLKRLEDDKLATATELKRVTEERQKEQLAANVELRMAREEHQKDKAELQKVIEQRKADEKAHAAELEEVRNEYQQTIDSAAADLLAADKRREE
ncbi:hypothetical protein HK097_002967, partial [Rhizophlyctis rosea]